MQTRQCQWIQRTKGASVLTGIIVLLGAQSRQDLVIKFREEKVEIKNL